MRAQAGDAAALGRLLSRVEAESDEARAALAEGYRSGGKAAQRSTALGEARLRRMAQYRALKCAEGLLCRRFAPARHPELAAMVERISRREIDPYTAGEWLLNFITGRRL